MKNVNVRIPDDLHARIKQAAGHDRRSLNAEILWLIECGLNQPDEADIESQTPSNPRGASA